MKRKCICEQNDTTKISEGGREREEKVGNVSLTLFSSFSFVFFLIPAPQSILMSSKAFTLRSELFDYVFFFCA